MVRVNATVSPVEFVEKQINLLLHAKNFARLTLFDLVIADAPPAIDCASRLALQRVIINDRLRLL
jgi:hypothetical protein